MSAAQLAYAGRILALIGGILLVLFSGLALLGFVFRIPFHSSLVNLDPLVYDFIGLVLGVVAILGSRQAGKLEWAIVLIIVGYLGGGFGGLLVLVGGVVGLVSRLVKYA